MIKTSLAFAAGVLTMAAVVYFAGAHFALPMFFAGIVAVVAPSVALLASTDRMRTVGRFLTTFADSWDGTARKPTPRVISGKDKNVWAYVKPSTKQRDQNTRDAAQEVLGDDLEWLNDANVRRVS